MVSGDSTVLLVSWWPLAIVQLIAGVVVAFRFIGQPPIVMTSLDRATNRRFDVYLAATWIAWATANLTSRWEIIDALAAFVLLAASGLMVWDGRRLGGHHYHPPIGHTEGGWAVGFVGLALVYPVVQQALGLDIVGSMLFGVHLVPTAIFWMAILAASRPTTPATPLLLLTAVALMGAALEVRGGRWESILIVGPATYSFWAIVSRRRPASNDQSPRVPARPDRPPQ
jgi:hypothetical protein